MAVIIRDGLRGVNERSVSVSVTRRRFSIVVSARNEEGNLRQAVETIARVFDGVSEDYEILLFDDASTDGTATIAEALARANRHVRVFQNPGG